MFPGFGFNTHTLNLLFDYPLWYGFYCLLFTWFVGQGSGFNIAGRLESGHVQVGESILVQPANQIANIKGIVYLTLTTDQNSLYVFVCVCVCSCDCE